MTDLFAKLPVPACLLLLLTHGLSVAAGEKLARPSAAPTI